MKVRGSILAFLAVLAVVPCFAQNPELAVSTSSVTSVRDAVDRLTRLTPTVPECEDAAAITVSVAGIADRAVPFELVLEIVPGPSVQVDSAILNLIQDVSGRLTLGSGPDSTSWTLQKVRLDTFFPKSYWNTGRLGFMLPSRFRDTAGAREDVFTVVDVICTLKPDGLDCPKVRFAFGDALSKLAGSERTARDLIADRAPSPDDVRDHGPSGPLAIGCSSGEWRCACMGCGPTRECPLLCPFCLPNACLDCSEIGCPGC